jgi:MYXO-CTERM domain-containing protein
MRRVFLASALLVSCSSNSNVDEAPRARSAAQVLSELAGFPAIAPRLSDRVAPSSVRASLPDRARGPLHVELTEDPEIALDVFADDLPSDGTPSVVDGARVHRGVASDVDVVHVLTREGPEEIRLVRAPGASLGSTFRVQLGKGLASLRARGDVIEAVDAQDVVRLRTAPMFAVDAAGLRIPLRAEIVQTIGRVVVARTTPVTSPLRYPVAIDPLWTAGSAMKVARLRHALTTLSDGRVLAAGGSGQSSAELYDPSTKTWTSTGSMAILRSSPTLTSLTGGTALVVGGASTTAASWGQTTAELFDASTGKWGGTILMHAGHVQHTATLLADGRVLVVGGLEVYNPGSVEIYDPASKAFAYFDLKTPRKEHASARLPSGKVLVTGGYSNGGGAAALATVEIVDPTSKLSTLAASMTNARYLHHAFTLPSGKILVFGGYDATGSVVAAIEIYDETTNTWSAAGTGSAVFMPTSAPLKSGGALFVGAYDQSVGYLELSGAFASEKIAIVPRTPSATLLSDGSVLVSGGDVGVGGPLPTPSSELFTPYANGTACTQGHECVSGNCVDGVCCDTACNGTCEACDATGSIGTCTAVTGAPHGSRGSCADGATDTCKIKSCNGVERKTCSFAGTDVVCSPGTCTSGTELGVAHCDGTGACGTPVSKPCLPYKCGPDACLSTCSTATDCADGYDCRMGTCQPKAAQCTPDSASVIDVNGVESPCAPFLCKAGKCVEVCGSSDDCAPGNVCDTGRCVSSASPAQQNSSGGCSVGGEDGATMPLLLALVGLGLLRRRR